MADRLHAMDHGAPVEPRTMSDVNEQIDEASALQLPKDASWSDRLSNAVSDYEVIGAEDAAGLGL
jgi:predicted phosphohydrolase